MEHLTLSLQKPRRGYVPFIPCIHCRLCSPSLLSDIGKILAGIQVPPSDYEEFDEYLKNLAYPYVEETDNAVYKRLLRG